MRRGYRKGELDCILGYRGLGVCGAFWDVCDYGCRMAPG